MLKQEDLIFEKSSPGRKAYSLPVNDVPEEEIRSLIPQSYLRAAAAELPEVSEIDVVRHFTG